MNDEGDFALWWTERDRRTNICDFRVTFAAEKEQLVDYLKVTQSGTKLWFIPIETNCSAG